MKQALLQDEVTSSDYQLFLHALAYELKLKTTQEVAGSDFAALITKFEDSSLSVDYAKQLVAIKFNGRLFVIGSVEHLYLFERNYPSLSACLTAESSGLVECSVDTISFVFFNENRSNVEWYTKIISLIQPLSESQSTTDHEKSRDEQRFVSEMINKYLKDKKNDHGFKSKVKALVYDASVISISRLAYSVANFFNMAIVGSKNQEFLEASPVIITLWRLYMTLNSVTLQPIIFMSSSISRSATISEHDKKERLRDISTAGLYASLLLGIPTALFMYHSNWLLGLIGVPKDSIAISARFFNDLSWGMPGVTLFSFQVMLLISASKMRFYFSVNAFSAMLSVAMTYILARGELGSKDYGIKGYALSTNINNYLCFFITLVYSIFSRDLGALKPRLKPRRMSQFKRDVEEIFYKGSYIFLLQAAEIIVFLVIAILAERLGDDPAIIEDIAQQALLGFTLILTTSARQAGIKALSACLAPQYYLKVSKEYLSQVMALKANVADNIQVAIKASYVNAVVMWLVNAVVLYSIPQYLAALYLDINDTDNKKLVRDICLQCRIMATAQLFDSIRQTQTGIINAFKETRVPAAASFFSVTGVGLPICYWLSRKNNMGVKGLEVGLLFGYIVGNGLLSIGANKVVSRYVKAELATVVDIQDTSTIEVDNFISDNAQRSEQQVAYYPKISKCQ